MNRAVLVWLLCALVQVGCASPPRLAQSLSERLNPQLTIRFGRLTVNPDPLYFAKGEKGEITWELHERSSFRFSPSGIAVEGRLVEPPQRDYSPVNAQDVVRSDLIIDKNQGEIVCPPQEGGRKFVCINRHTRPGIYKYSIRVSDGATVIELDPSIVNM